MLIAICERPGISVRFGSLVCKLYSRVNVAIPGLQRNFDSFADLIGLRLPCSEADAGHLVSCVEDEDFPAVHVSQTVRVGTRVVLT